MNLIIVIWTLIIMVLEMLILWKSTKPANLERHQIDFCRKLTRLNSFQFLGLLIWVDGTRQTFLLDSLIISAVVCGLSSFLFLVIKHNQKHLWGSELNGKD